MADFTLVVGVDPKLSFEELKTGIEDIVSKINKEPVKIKIGIDPESLASIKSQIAGTVKGAVNTATGAGGVNIDLGLGKNSFQRNAEYGASARSTIQELKRQASEMENIFKNVTHEADGMMAVFNSLSGTNILKKTGIDIFSLGNKLGDSKASLSSQMDAWKQYINIMQEAAKVKGIDLRSVTASANKSADEMVEATRKLQTGEQEAEDVIEKLKQAFSGIGDGIAKPLTESISQMGEQIGKSMQEISRNLSVSIDKESESVDGVNNGYGEHTKSIDAAIEAEEKKRLKSEELSKALEEESRLLNQNDNRKNNTNDSLREALSAAKEYTALMRQADAQERRLLSVDGGAETSAYTDLQKYKAGLDAAYEAYAAGETNAEDYKVQILALGQAFESAKRDVEKYVSAQKGANQANSKSVSNELKYEQTLKRLNKALIDYSGAEHSSNEESRKAYESIKKSRDELVRAHNEKESGTKTEKEFSNQLSASNIELEKQSGKLIQNGNATKSWSSQFKDMAKQLSQWVTPMRILMKVIQYVKKMVSASIELNDAMTQMQIVTRASDSEMAKFGETAAAAAKRIGSSITDFVSSATTYARLGYNTEESSMFAEYTAMLQNVGDIGVEDAQNAVTAIVKAYSIAPDELKKVMDKMVTIGNGFPISVAQIAEGMNNASSTLAAAGNSFEQSVALLTAANTTVQNASKAATGLRTITARLRNTKADLEELGEDMTEAKYEELVKTLTGTGVALTDVNNNYRSTYEIMKDIAAAWKDMNDEQKSALVTQLAGTRQQDIFYSIINNFREAEEAYGEMVNNSTGALDTAYSTYMNSATAHINQFKAAFQELSANFIDSKLVGDVAEIGSSFVKALNWITQLLNKVGGLKTLLIAIAGVIATIKADLIKTEALKFFTKIGVFLGDPLKKLKEFSLAIQLVKQNTLSGTGAFQKMSDALGLLNINVSSAQLAMGAFAAALGAVLLIINKVKQAEQERRAEASNKLNEAQETARETEELYNLYNTYKSIKKTYDDSVEAKEALETATLNLAEALKIEGDVAARSEQSIKKMTKAQLEDAMYQATDARARAQSVLANDIGGGTIRYASQTHTGNSPQQIISRALLKNDEFIGAKWITFTSEQKAEALVKAYEYMIDYQKRMIDNGEEGTSNYIKLGKAIDYLKDDVIAYTNAQELEIETTKRLNDLTNGTNVNKIAQNVSLPKGIDALKASLDKDSIAELKEEIEDYKEILSEIDNAGLSLDKTVFGNIDTNDRQVLEWTVKNIEKFKNELSDWKNPEESVEDYLGSIATVLGSYESFEGLDIAFSPILQTEDGPKLLTKDVVYRYIWGLIDMVNAEHPNGWSSEDLFKLDLAGIEFDGQIIKGLIADIGETAKQTSEAMHYMGTDGALSRTIPILKKIAEQYGITVDEIISCIKELETESAVSTYGQIQDLDKGLKLLGEIYDDVKDQGVFDYSKILNNKDFDDAFSGIGEEYNEFIRTVAESPKDIQKCQTAFNNLVRGFIQTKGALNDLTDAEREAAIAMLKQGGVVNAAEIVDFAIAQSAGTIDSLTSAYQSATGKTYDFKNATEAEVLALYNEQAAGSVAQKVVAQLYLEKRNLNNTQINTANDVEQILNIAKAAGAGAQYLINLQDALNHLNNIPTKFYDENGNVLTKKKDIVAARQRYIQDYLKVANNATKDMDFEIAIPDVNWTGYGGANTSSKGTNAGKTKTAEEQAQDAFLLEYKRHKHLVEMEQETQQQFFDWLDSAYKKVYKAGTEEYWKYEEEVMSGYRNLFKDITSDLEHEISMREMFDGEAKAIDGIYVTLIQKVEAQLALMRGKGLKDTDDYIQELQKLWQKYVDDRKKLRDDTADKAKDALDALIDYRVKKLKQDIENERDALKKRLDAAKEFYDKQKELLRDQRDEEKYLDEQSEKRKAVRDIEKQLNQLALDDSAWAQKKKLELSNELTNAQKELSEFERDHAIDMAEDQLDKQYELIEDNYNKQDELLEKKLNNEKLLRDQALEDLRTNSAAIYAEILQWNIEYGDGITNTITSAWEDAYTALNNYKTLYGQLFNNVNLANVTGVNTGASWDTVKPSDKGSKSGVSGVSYSASSPSTTTKSGTPGNGDINGDGKVNAEDARLALNAAVKKISLTADQIRRGDINGDGKITADDASKILKKAVKMGYASGTHRAVPGLHMIDENGDETIFQSKDGNKYKLFAGGEKVLNAKASDFLYRFANGGVDILKNAVGDALRSNFVNLFTKGSGDIEITTGNIIIQGNADKATVSEIRRAQREQLDTILNTFNKLKA